MKNNFDKKIEHLTDLVNQQYQTTMDMIERYNAIINKQANEIANLRKYLNFSLEESEYDEGSWNDAAWGRDDISIKEMFDLLWDEEDRDD